MIIQSKNLNEIRKQIQKALKENPKEEIIVKAEDEDFNAKVLEIKGVKVLLAPEQHDRKDKLKQRDSGMNEFIARLAKKNNITIAIDLDSLKGLEKKEKARVLARIKQNIMLCKKTGCKIVLFPIEKFSNIEAVSFFTVFGGATTQGKI